VRVCLKLALRWLNRGVGFLSSLVTVSISPFCCIFSSCFFSVLRLHSFVSAFFSFSDGPLCDLHGYYGQDIQAHLRSTSRLSAFVSPISSCARTPDTSSIGLLVCIKEAVCWIWSEIHRGFVLHLIRVSISLGPVAFFILNQYLLQSVPAVLQKRSLLQTDITRGIDRYGMVGLGRRAYMGQGPPLFFA